MDSEDWFMVKEKRQNTLYKSTNVKNKAAECFQQDIRFEEDPEQWRISGLVTLGHVLMPLAFIIPVWILLLVRKYKEEKF